jgi:restriction system protein
VARRQSWDYLRSQQILLRRAAAEDRREARRAELDRIADEKARHRRYLEHREEEVRELNAHLDQTVSTLSQILTERIRAKDWPLNFDSVKDPAALPPFDTKGADKAALAPALEDFMPTPPRLLQRLFNEGRRHYEEKAELARVAFKKASKKHATAELARKLRLVQARKDYAASCEAIEAKAAIHNAEIDALRRRYFNAQPEAVATYYSMVFGNDTLPEGFPTAAKFAFVPESKQLVIERELPISDVVPDVTIYRYVKGRDKIESSPRAMSQRHSIYARLVAQMALRTLFGGFAADAAGILETIVLSCFVDTIDAATGHPVRPCLLTVRTNKEMFDRLDLARVEPIACLKALGAQVSRSPAELAPVRPIVDFNMVDKRFVESTDVLAELDQRPNLMELSPSDFENLITNLFTNMGLETRLTQASRDGGVDCVAWDMRPIVGGKVIVQAKRYRNTVGVSAVRDLYGAVMNEGAAKGILVTTSGYGKSSFDFAEHKPLELVTGSNLLYLLEEHTGVKARIEMPDDWVDPLPDLATDEVAVPGASVEEPATTG